jgi:hypothetical protein
MNLELSCAKRLLALIACAFGLLHEPEGASANYLTVGALVADCENVRLPAIKRDMLAANRCTDYVGSVRQELSKEQLLILRNGMQDWEAASLDERISRISTRGGFSICRGEEVVSDSALATLLVKKYAGEGLLVSLDPSVGKYVSTFLSSLVRNVDEPAQSVDSYTWCDFQIGSNQLDILSFHDIVGICSQTNQFVLDREKLKSCKATLHIVLPKAEKEITKEALEEDKHIDLSKVSKKTLEKMRNGASFKLCFSEGTKLTVPLISSALLQYAQTISVSSQFHTQAVAGVKQAILYVVDASGGTWHFCYSE